MMSNTEQPTLMIDTLLERIDYDLEIAQELVQLFICESAETLEQLSLEVRTGTSNTLVERQAHKLKGLCRDIGAENLASMLAQLELLMRNNNVQNSNELMAQIQAAYSVLSIAIQDWLQNPVKE